MAVERRPEPSIPTPTIPNRTRSLAESDWKNGVRESSTRPMEPDARGCAGRVLDTREAPAAPAVVCRNLRREKKGLFMLSFHSWNKASAIVRFAARVKPMVMRGQCMKLWDYSF